ncbi:MAG: hypothetical protein IKX65_08255 [Prevotella sp.]|nr:hypothetical protein [Prevotella sp.]
MKRVLFCMVVLFVAMNTYAQGEKCGFWNGVEHIELTPDESFIYRYVQAMDGESAKTLNDLYDSMEAAGDKSILKRNGGMEWYVKNDYPLPEGDYYESPVYWSSEGYDLVVRPGIMVYLKAGLQIDGLLEYLGDKVRVDIYEDDYEEKLFVRYVLECKVRTSDEVLDIINAMHEFGLEDMSFCYMPLTWSLDTAAINKLTGADEGSEEEGDGLIAEIDWTTYDYYYGWDWDFVVVVKDVGMIIDCASYDNAEYWEPQIPIIAHIPELKKGGHYLVKFSIISPAAGEIRLDLCSWDGSGAAKALIINVEAGEKEYSIDFPDYPTTCTDAMLFYQCGHMPGQHIIKKVQVYKINESSSKETGIEDVKAVNTKKVDGAIYNLAGQKVNASYKGIVIRNGKRYVVK